MKYLNTIVKVGAVFPGDGKFYPKYFLYRDVYTVTRIRKTWVNNNWEHGREHYFEVQVVNKRNALDERICQLYFMSEKNVWVLSKF